MDKIKEALTRGVAKIYPDQNTLEKLLRSGKKIRLYQGFDPSMPNLHLGHLVGLIKLRQFQQLGHEVIFLVGDFTGMIGDPTDKISARRQLSRQQVITNSQNWQKQAGRILNLKGKNPLKWLFNSKWNDQITFKDLIGITSHLTVQQLIERDFFQQRINRGRPIYLHEFLYPVAQGYDSVAMDVDLEIGGNDQTFNMLIGRSLMKSIAKKEKFVLTTKLLTDARGQKAGKTTGNAIFLNSPATVMFGQIMAFSDELIVPGFELLTTVPIREVRKIKRDLKKPQANPMESKKSLAFQIVKLCHGQEKARQAQEEFERVFQKGQKPTKAKIVNISKKEMSIIDLLLKSKVVTSRSQAKRLVTQKAVDINGKNISDPSTVIHPINNMSLRVGKKQFVKIKTN